MLMVFGRRFAVVISILTLLSCVVGIKQYGSSGTTLYVTQEQGSNGIKIINREYTEEPNLPGERIKRDASLPQDFNNKNISTWTNHLNDSHQQLMVHWVGEGSNVIICLARDSSPRNKGGLAASSLYISYDYGKNFTNKTESFKLEDKPDSEYAQLDKFFNHPKYPEFCVFVDTTNKKLYYTSDNGRNIQRSNLTFHPSELAFDEEFPHKYVILDKVDSNRRLYLTLDGGKTFKQISIFVKAFFWSSGADIFTKKFYVERWKPNNTSTVLVANDPAALDSAQVLFEDAKDFQIKGDFMFATKQSKERNTLDLYISHQRGPFFKAEFQTELDLRKFHIADVTDKRIFISVMHTESLANLYVSQISSRFNQYNFVLSLEQIVCYFPDGNWKDSWLEDVTEDSFTDLYRVEGLSGIYIASKVDSKVYLSNIAPEHLISLITYDHGSTWAPIKPPTEDENGKPLNCHIENSCSLHLCQKFSQLYPVTRQSGYVISNDEDRSASIMSSKSAPGIIMATGVMGKSLKGIPGVYLSRDAGLTWKRILKDYYFFNYGDHGGVLVAVKYYKSRGETRKILYSTNEGMEWNSYQFNADDLRIYGLMTEPGENTTTFTMFGSANNHHKWIIITIDLQNAFPRNCTQDDYKFWSPSPANSTVSCVLGTKDIFQRRLAHTNCYNGVDYDRPVKKVVCQCSRSDYECDLGFTLAGEACIHNDSKYNPYAIPADCRPGQFYKSTKGYRKIDGDVCTAPYYLAYEPDTIPCPIEEPTEFILVALRDKIARIDLADNSSLYPVQGQKNIVAIEFDMKNNCIYWADIENDKISRQCFNNGTTPEVVVSTDLSSIEGMALDWISNVLFFADGIRKKIEAVRTDLTSEGRMRATILDSKVLSKPRGIAVHPKAGYLFWTDWDRNLPSVSRSNLDGTNVKKLFGKPIVQWPNGITIDHMSERIYWVDAKEDYIASADINGQYFRRILWNDAKVTHPFAIAVLKDNMYWNDWKAKSIFIANKYSGLNVITINNSFSGLMDLKVFAHFVQHGSNACSYKNTSCDTLCLGGPLNTFSCLCPDGFTKVKGKCECPNGMAPLANMTCPKKIGTTCEPDQFSCGNGLCVSAAWRCDGNNDCGDMSDELHCPMCTPPMLACDDNTRCYLPHWACDGDVDCADMSDEKDCGKHNCTESQYQCDNGQCIDKKWLCDGDNDCKDGSDERNCTSPSRRPDPVNCSANGFSCGAANSSLCVPNSWVCDGERDCPGGEDETPERCKSSTCATYMFRCPNGKCIFRTWVCDGENDCSDVLASDEKDCPAERAGTHKLLPRPSTEPPVNFGNTTCLKWMSKCDNGNCVPLWWRCDGIDDCGDGSDEAACAPDADGERTERVRPGPAGHVPEALKCAKNQFTCAPGVCIPLSWVCDTADDCADGSDERGCETRPRGDGGGAGGAGGACDADATPCADGRGCVRDDQLCDGTPQCADRSDEEHCPDTGASSKPAAVCPAQYAACDDGAMCVSPAMLCNGHRDCLDGSDEANCTATAADNGYKLVSIGVDQSSINSSSFLISLWMPQKRAVQYSFLPAIAKVGEDAWRNMTWTNDSVYRFTDLEAYTNYNVTFYIRDSKSNNTYASMKYVNTTTGEGVPSPPQRVTVRQMIGSRVSVVWDPPARPRGAVSHYTLHFAPWPAPAAAPGAGVDKYVPARGGNASHSVSLRAYFRPNQKYVFWVRATNGAFTSNASEPAYMTFDDVGDVDALVNVTVARPNASAATLHWHKIRGADGYRVQLNLPQEYLWREPLTTTGDNITLTDLPPGVQLYIDIMAYKGSVVGDPFTVPLKTQGEPHETLTINATLAEGENTTVQLHWSPPKGDRYKNKDIEYEVHYTSEIHYRRLRSRVNTTTLPTRNTSMTVSGLRPCAGYVFMVALRGGPLSNLAGVITRADPKAPVKNLYFSFDDKTGELQIYWSVSCYYVREPIAYRLDIVEQTRNKTSRYLLMPTKNVTCRHTIDALQVGGRYNICVYADVSGAARACGGAFGARVPVPRGVVARRAPDGRLAVAWRGADTDASTPTRIDKYEVIVSDKEIPEDSLHMPDGVTTVSAAGSPATVPAGAGRTGPLYVGVRAVTADGFYSDLSEVQTIQMDDSRAAVALPAGDEAAAVTAAGAGAGAGASPRGLSALWWGCAGVLLVGGALAVVAAHFALKRRRRTLATSFQRYAERAPHTPRYDSRRGQATIAANSALDHDDDDVPPIQGFSDDEPLVIA